MKRIGRWWADGFIRIHTPCILAELVKQDQLDIIFVPTSLQVGTLSDGWHWGRSTIDFSSRLVIWFCPTDWNLEVLLSINRYFYWPCDASSTTVEWIVLARCGHWWCWWGRRAVQLHQGRRRMSNAREASGHVCEEIRGCRWWEVQWTHMKISSDSLLLCTENGQPISVKNGRKVFRLKCYRWLTRSAREKSKGNWAAKRSFGREQRRSYVRHQQGLLNISGRFLGSSANWSGQLHLGLEILCVEERQLDGNQSKTENDSW